MWRVYSQSHATGIFCVFPRRFTPLFDQVLFVVCYIPGIMSVNTAAASCLRTTWCSAYRSRKSLVLESRVEVVWHTDSKRKLQVDL